METKLAQTLLIFKPNIYVGGNNIPYMYEKLFPFILLILLMNRIKLALLVLGLALISSSTIAQNKEESKLRWGVTAGMNGFDAGKADLSHDRGRCGFNVAARMELLFRTTPSRPYMDVELGLLNLNWKKHYAHHISDFQTGEQTDYDQTFRRNAYYLHLPIHLFHQPTPKRSYRF